MHRCEFLPRDAMLARHLLSSRVRLSVYPSVTSRYCTETTAGDETSWFWHRSFFPPIPHCVIRKFGYLQNLVDRVLSTKLVVVDGRAC